MVYTPVGITAGTSSFDVEPMQYLDPVLFDGHRMRPHVRMGLLSIIDNFFDSFLLGRDQWLRVWMAGSGASYRWHAAPDLKDLDMLLGIDFVNLRRTNPGFNQVGDKEIAQHLNEEMRQKLWPATSEWNDRYEVTWYVNPGSWDIRRINPYAAYDLIEDDWTVPPTSREPVVPKEWELQAQSYHERAKGLVTQYSDALTNMQNATHPAHRVNAERRFQMTLDQATDMFDVIHSNRRNAFSSTGSGYDDFHNYVWQQGKKSGWIPALKQIRDYHQQASSMSQVQRYGVELPDSDTLIRRAALQYQQ